MSLAKIKTKKDGKLIMKFVNRPQNSIQPSKRLPVQIKVEPYKIKRNRNRLRESISSWYSSSQSHNWEEPARKVKKWFKKKVEVHEKKTLERKKEQRRIKEWNKWKKEEERLIRKAEEQRARELKERELAEQLCEIQKERRRIAKDTLKTIVPPPKVDRNLAVDNLNVSTYETGENKLNSDDSPVQSTTPIKEKCKPKHVKAEKKPKEPKIKKEKEKKKDKELKPEIKPVEESTTLNTKKGKIKQKTLPVNERPVKQTISTKFVHCFYKTCCQFYCWLTVILIFGVTIIVLL